MEPMVSVDSTATMSVWNAVRNARVECREGKREGVFLRGSRTLEFPCKLFLVVVECPRVQCQFSWRALQELQCLADWPTSVSAPARPPCMKIPESA
jgi:hypothetical protein